MRRPWIALGLLTGTAFLALPVCAGAPPALSGGILGVVKNGTGVAQMGASVLLYDRYDQLVRRTLTNEEGKFAFALLNPDSYTVRVTLASFVPALRRNIAVAAGSENVLQINLTSLFSTIDIVSSGPSRGALMSDDWKWVLRSSQSTRPVLRLLPSWSSSQTTAANSSMFSNTTGILTLSAGDGESFASGAEQATGTAFAVATSLFGTSRVLLSGNVGYSASSGLPTAGFRTSYSRSHDGDAGPEVTLTVRQLYLSPRAAPAGGESGPALRTASLAIRDKVNLSDHLSLDYGLSMESVSFLERLNYMSPFARATYDLGSKGLVRVGYSDGGQPTELASPGRSQEGATGESINGASLNQDLAALTTLPRVSLADDRIRVQRTQNFEMGYQRAAGKTTYTAAVYRESVSNAAFMFSGAASLPPADALPDLGTNSQIFNVGSFDRIGYTAAMKQSLTDHVEASVAAGSTGGLTADGVAVSDTAGLRSALREQQKPWMTASVTMTVPASGTRIQSAYGWTDPRMLMPDHYFMTGDVTQATGWNIRVRQPLPFVPGIGGRLEATAELRNMLAQGYLPINYAGQKSVLTNAPRAVRGGLAFIF